MAGEEPGADPAEAFFAGHPFGVETYRRIRSIVEGHGPVTVRVSRSQVAFMRRRAFAWLWLPGRWLTKARAEVVLSFALDQRDESTRLKQVVQPAPRVWMHHLEVRTLAELDDEVGDWLREAAEHRG